MPSGQLVAQEKLGVAVSGLGRVTTTHIIPASLHSFAWKMEVLEEVFTCVL